MIYMAIFMLLIDYHTPIKHIARLCPDFGIWGCIDIPP